MGYPILALSGRMRAVMQEKPVSWSLLLCQGAFWNRRTMEGNHKLEKGASTSAILQEATDNPWSAVMCCKIHNLMILSEPVTNSFANCWDAKMAAENNGQEYEEVSFQPPARQGREYSSTARCPLPGQNNVKTCLQMTTSCCCLP